MIVRLDVVARAFLDNIADEPLTDADWLALEMDDEGHDLIEACREAARTVIAASDHVMGTLH